MFLLGYHLPWEEKSWQYPNNFASPLQIIIDASNGASDYGNKFGEPVISGTLIYEFFLLTLFEFKFVTYDLNPLCFFLMSQDSSNHMV